MNKVKILPITVYEFHCDDILTDRMESIVKHIQYTKNTNNKGSPAYEKIDDSIFTDWINQCLNQVKREIYGETQWNLIVTQVWANKANMAEFHHKHVHPNSILSGIFYFNDFDRGGETNFFTPNLYWNAQKDGYLRFNHLVSSFDITDTIKPSRGKLIIFPSTLQHSVNPVIKITDTRYTIAFNSFFKGEIGRKSDATYLNI